MASWRPPRSAVERNARAIRSMQNGSLDGRIVGAFPVKGDLDNTLDDEFDQILEEDDPNTGGGTDKGVLLPATEYFRIGDYGRLVFTLKETPYFGEPRLGGQNSTFHLYWNNLFQRDMSYVLEGRTLVIRDPLGVLDRNDVLTVKYWWTEGGDGGGNGFPKISIFSTPLEGWLSSADPYVRYGGFAADGALSATIGVNGAPTTVCTHFTTIGFLSSFSGSIRVPNGVEFDLDNMFDAMVQFRTPEIMALTQIAHKYECGLGGASEGGVPASGYVSTPSPTIKPSIAPGGKIIYTGSEAQTLAHYLHAKINSTEHKAYVIHLSDPGPTGENGGCYVFAGTPDRINVDDTLYGKSKAFIVNWQGKFGGTLTVFSYVDEDS